MDKEQILAMKPGRELDALVANMLGTSYTVGVGCLDLPRFSTDIAAAWEVVEKMRHQRIGVNWLDTMWSPVGWHCWINDGREAIHAFGCETAPEAIAKAALLATMEDNDA